MKLVVRVKSGGLLVARGVIALGLLIGCREGSASLAADGGSDAASSLDAASPADAEIDAGPLDAGAVLDATSADARDVEPDGGTDAGSPLDAGTLVEDAGTIDGGADAGPCDACCTSPADCDDSVPCTIDSCLPAGSCLHTRRVCAPDMDPCTAEACEPSTGSCVSLPVHELISGVEQRAIFLRNTATTPLPLEAFQTCLVIEGAGPGDVTFCRPLGGVVVPGSTSYWGNVAELSAGGTRTLLQATIAPVSSDTTVCDYVARYRTGSTEAHSRAIAAGEWTGPASTDPWNYHCALATNASAASWERCWLCADGEVPLGPGFGGTATVYRDCR